MRLKIASGSEQQPPFLRVVVLLVIFLVLAAMPLVFIMHSYRQNNGCEAYFDLSIAYNFAPSSCLEYSIRKYVVPLIALAAPSLFLMAVMILKEGAKRYELAKARQESHAFFLSSVSAVAFGLSAELIRHINCEGFGCLGTAPLVAANFSIFPPLVFGFSLWFLKARYKWKKPRYLVTVLVQTALLLLAYMQTPLI